MLSIWGDLSAQIRPQDDSVIMVHSEQVFGHVLVSAGSAPMKPRGGSPGWGGVDNQSPVGEG
jgi:hypothetical protein